MNEISGTLLSNAEIERRLSRGEIFRTGTWSRENFRGAAYDLTMADDLMVVPDPPRSPGGRRYRRGEKRTNDVILNPGDVAFVSSREKFCLPWDIAGNLGAKFGLTAKGVLILTGICVDPGYGLIPRSEESEIRWYPKADQRIHILIANVGPRPVVLRPGKEKIAAVQFFCVEEPEIKNETHSLGYKGVEEEFFDAQGTDAGLVFFRDMSEVRTQVSGFKRELEQFELRARSVENSASHIVVFGIFVICAALISAAFASILSLGANLKQPIELSFVGQPLLLAALLLAACVVSSALSCFLTVRWMGRPSRNVEAAAEEGDDVPDRDRP